MATYVPGENFLKVSEIAGHYRVSKSTIYRWIADGELKTFHVRGSLRVSRTHLDQLMTKNAPPARSWGEYGRAD